MNAISFLQKTDRTHEESEFLVKKLIAVVKAASIFVGYLSTKNEKFLRSRPKQEMQMYIDLKAAIMAFGEDSNDKTV